MTVAAGVFLLSTLTLKPIKSFDLNRDMPMSKYDLTPGTYFIKVKHLMNVGDVGYDQPKGAKYEINCVNNDQDELLWLDGYQLVKFKHTDSGDSCTLMSKEEYRYVIEHQQRE